VARNKDTKMITKTWREYEDGKNYNLQLNIYEDTDRNERFYAGDQWNGLNAPGMPTPVFNIFKRVINYFIAAILQQPVKLRYFPMLSNEDSEEEDMVEMNEAAELISSYADTLLERLKMDSKNRQLLLDAALSGDMVTYLFWNPSIKTGQESLGDIDLELIDGVNVYFGNPNQSEVEKQPYIIIAFRELVTNLQKEAKANGVPKKEYERISSDLDNLYTAGDRGKVELNNNGGTKIETGKTTALLRLWKKDGKVMASKSTKFCPVRGEWDTKLEKYSVAMNNWDKRKNSYHGQALGTGIVPNQIYINQQFALIMIFMRDMGFPKVLFDKALIAAWSNKVGGSFGVNPGPGGLGSAAQYMTPATMNTQMFTSIDMAIKYTKEFLGANDAALGDVNPDNARALAIVTEQAAVPLANIKANLYQLHEDIGYIMLDLMANFYGTRKVTVIEKGKRVVKEFDFSKLKDIPMSLKVEVGPGTLYSELAGQATIDRLLEQDKITFLQWLRESMPGVVPGKQNFIDAEEEIEEAQVQQANGDADFREQFIAGLSPEDAEVFRQMTPEEQEEILKGATDEVPSV